MQLVCPKCGRTIAGEDIDLGRGLGLCKPCGELVPLPGPVALAPAFAPAAPARLYKPESFRLSERYDGDRYEAVLPPNRLRALPALGFCLFWDTFMAVWYGIAIVGHVWPMAIFGLLHLGVGIVITHKTLVALFNTRRLVLAGGQVTWRSSPVPDRGNLNLPIELVDGFALRDKSTAKTQSVVVVANLADGTMRELDVDATDPPTAQYAAECFQEALRLAKQRAGEGPYRG
jgi:hypothetical protein